MTTALHGRSWLVGTAAGLIPRVEVERHAGIVCDLQVDRLRSDIVAVGDAGHFFEANAAAAVRRAIGNLEFELLQIVG